MSISNKDKKGLFLLLGVLIIAAALFFGFRPLFVKGNELAAENEKLSAKYQELLSKQAKKDEYIQKTKEFEDQYQRMINEFPADLTAEESIAFVVDMEQQTNVWISQVGFGEKVSAYEFGQDSNQVPEQDNTVDLPTEKENADAIEEAAGMIDGTDAEPEIKNTIITDGLSGISTGLTLTYQGGYSEMKQLLNYIYSYRNRLGINSINMSYNGDNQMINGTITLTEWGVAGEDRVLDPTKWNAETGTDNIFNPSGYTGTLPSVGQQSQTQTQATEVDDDYDYYAMLNPVTADLDAEVIGKKGDTTKETLLTANENQQQRMLICFSGSNGQYQVQYTLGNQQYPAENYSKGAKFEPGESLDFYVLSCARVGEDDHSGAKISILNKTDMPLKVKVLNDDKTYPRFAKGTVTGDVTFE